MGGGWNRKNRRIEINSRDKSKSKGIGRNEKVSEKGWLQRCQDLDKRWLERERGRGADEGRKEKLVNMVMDGGRQGEESQNRRHRAEN